MAPEYLFQPPHGKPGVAATPSGSLWKKGWPLPERNPLQSIEDTDGRAEVEEEVSQPEGGRGGFDGNNEAA